MAVQTYTDSDLAPVFEDVAAIRDLVEELGQALDRKENEIADLTARLAEAS